MILLTATRVDAYGHCKFEIAAEGEDVIVTSDALKAAKILARMGVATPLRLVEHAREWGSIEIQSRSEPAST